MSNIVYIGETNNILTKYKIYKVFFEGSDRYFIGTDISYITYIYKEEGIYLDKWRESRLNKLLE